MVWSWHFIANVRRRPSFRRRAFLQYAAATEKTTTTAMVRDHISSRMRMTWGNAGVIAIRTAAPDGIGRSLRCRSIGATLPARNAIAARCGE